MSLPASPPILDFLVVTRKTSPATDAARKATKGQAVLNLARGSVKDGLTIKKYKDIHLSSDELARPFRCVQDILTSVIHMFLQLSNRASLIKQVGGQKVQARLCSLIAALLLYRRFSFQL